VLAPLAAIAPGWRHPVLGRTVEELLESLADAAGVVLVESADWAADRINP